VGDAWFEQLPCINASPAYWLLGGGDGEKPVGELQAAERLKR